MVEDAAIDAVVHDWDDDIDGGVAPKRGVALGVGDAASVAVPVAHGREDLKTPRCVVHQKRAAGAGAGVAAAAADIRNPIHAAQPLDWNPESP